MKKNWTIFAVWLLVAAILYFGLLAMELNGCDTRTATSPGSDDRSAAAVDDDTDDGSGDNESAGEKADRDREQDKKNKKERDDESDRGSSGSGATIDSVIEAVSGLRGLPVKTDIEVSYLDSDELQEQVEDEFAREYDPGEVEAEELALKSLGLIDEGIDLLDEMEQLLTEQIAGYYDDETKELALISDAEELDVMNEVTLSHEAAHALQDQSFNLGAFYPLEGPATADASFARLALVEGDASLVMTEYVEEELSISDLLGLGFAAGGELSGMGSYPPYLEDSLMFPYSAGEEFVAFLKDEGGWGYVNGAYAHPPASTEQILHPEKYLEGDQPVYVEAPDLLPLAGPAWELVYDESFGEFDVQQMLLGGLRYGDAYDAAEGWGGGRFTYYERSDGAVMSVILLVWDDKAEADEFTLSMQEHLEYVYCSDFAFEDHQFPILDSCDGDYWVMVSRGTAVMVARVPDKTLANMLPAAILKAEPPEPSILDSMPPGSMLTAVRKIAGLTPVAAPAE